MMCTVLKPSPHQTNGWYLIKYNEFGQIEWQQIYQNNEGNDWAGEAIALSNDNGAVVAVDNGAFGFLKDQSVLIALHVLVF